MVLLLAQFSDEGSLSPCLKLIHTTTIPISTASITQKYNFPYPGFRLDFLLPSSGSNKKLHNKSVILKPLPSCMHYVMVTWLAVIGLSPPTTLVSRPIQSFHIVEGLQNSVARGGLQTWNHESSATGYYVIFSMTSYNRCQKDVTTNLYSGTDKCGVCPSLAI